MKRTMGWCVCVFTPFLLSIAISKVRATAITHSSYLIKYRFTCKLLDQNTWALRDEWDNNRWLGEAAMINGEMMEAMLGGK